MPRVTNTRNQKDIAMKRILPTLVGLWIAAVLTQVASAAVLLNNDTLMGAGRTISAQWTVFQPFTITDLAWQVTSIGVDGFEDIAPAGTGMLGTLLPDNGAGQPDEANPIASAVYFMSPPMGGTAQWRDQPFNVMLPAGRYWMRWDANGDIGYFGAVWRGVSGENSFSRNNFSGGIFNSDPTALRIFGQIVYPCPDLNGNGSVDLTDLSILLTNFGADIVSFEKGDINGDGVIDLTDLALMLSMFDDTCE